MSPTHTGAVRALRRLALVALLAALAGCGTIRGWFNDTKKENIEPPTPLAKDFVPSLSVTKVWRDRIGKGAEKTGVPMHPTLVDGKLYAASATGDIEAWDAATGRRLWSRHLGSRPGFILHRGFNSVRFAGGPGVDGDLLVVGTLEGEVYAFSVGDGQQRWNVQMPSEVLAAPAIGGGTVVVRTGDGKISGLSRADGSRQWVYDRDQVPVLSLRGNSAPVIANGVVFSGNDNGKLVALRLTDGMALWEQVLSTGEGRTEIDRLQDVDGQILVDGGVVYAVGYKGQVQAISAQTGRPIWTRELSSYSGVAISASQVYLSDPDANVYALDLRSGSSEWRQEALKYRWLSEPAVQGDAVIVGDLEGWVHWLSISDGKLLARVRVSKNPIRSAPVVAGDMVYVEDIYGELAAYRVNGK